jgi:lipoprotein-anchoring transpeptidase ErfK/SrfK
MAAGPRRARRRPLGLLAVVAVAAAAATGAAAVSLRASGPAGEAAPASGVPPPVPPAFTPGPPRLLGSTRHLSRWAPVRRPVVARAAARAGAAPVAALASRTPEGTDNAVAVLERRQDRTGVAWVRVRLPVLPNGTTAWVPRSALGGYVTVHTRLDVDLRRLSATLSRDGRPVFRAGIGVGTASSPTPTGEFYVRNRLTRYRSATYGPVAFGTSARSPTATDWPAGGFIGIHGTDRPDLLPGRVSHGCIRMRNADILELARRMPVGTPVVIQG